MRRALLSFIGAAALTVAACPTARAQEGPATAPSEETDPNACPPGMVPNGEVPVPRQPYAETPAPLPYPKTARRRALFSPYQTSFSVGGGAAGFIRDRIENNSSVAGAWDARLMLGTRSIIALEASYLGSAQHALDPFAERTISTTQVYGSARLNATVWRFQPFLTAGIGWANLHRWGGASGAAESPVAAANFADNVNSVMVPFSGGLATYFGEHGMLDARFDYHLITSKDFTPTGARPDMWVAELRAGYAF